MLRKVASQIKHRLKETVVHWQRRRGLVQKKDWEGSLLNDELDFWGRALSDGGRNWNPEEFRVRTNPQLELQSELRELMAAPSGSVVRILDVGAGPLTRVGRKWPGREVLITATDPLADRYNELLKNLGIAAPVPVTFAHAEKLLDCFPPDHFDLAYASNALDHSYDPLQAITQMLAVTKPDHYVYLWHFANEGKHECYNGLHQWNFDVRKGDFIVSDGKATHSLSAHFGPAIQLKCERQTAFNAEVVIAILKKTGVR